MKRLTIALAVLFCLAVTARFARAGAQDFQLYSRTGVDIHQLYISAADREDWEEDLLGGKVLQNGADVTVNFPDTESAARWDMMARDSEGNGIYWRDIDLVQATEIILEADGVARIKN